MGEEGKWGKREMEALAGLSQVERRRGVVRRPQVGDGLTSTSFHRQKLSEPPVLGVVLGFSGAWPGRPAPMFVKSLGHSLHLRSKHFVLMNGKQEKRNC